MIVAASTWVSIAAFQGRIPDSTLELMIADGLNPIGLFGHMLLHGDYVHLAGNMLFLWIFGNAVCGMIGNFAYLIAYPLCGALAAALHHFVVGVPLIGASGAINGVVGFVLAICPLNRVTLCFCLLFPSATFTLPAWQIILVWLAFDIRGALRGAGFIAYWAHLGGFATGVACGLAMLRAELIALTEWDNATLLDLLRGRRHSHASRPEPVLRKSVAVVPAPPLVRSLEPWPAVPSPSAAAAPLETPSALQPDPSPASAQPFPPRTKLTLRRRTGSPVEASRADNPTS